MSPRKRSPLLEKPPCPVCGVEYRDWRGEYPGGFKGPLAGHKASAWALHCERCEAFPVGAADFDPAAFAADVRTYCAPTIDSDAPDDWGAPMDVDPVAVCLAVAWEAREALARRVLGPDWARVQAP